MKICTDRKTDTGTDNQIGIDRWPDKKTGAQRRTHMGKRAKGQARGEEREEEEEEEKEEEEEEGEQKGRCRKRGMHFFPLFFIFVAHVSMEVSIFSSFLYDTKE